MIDTIKKYLKKTFHSEEELDAAPEECGVPKRIGSGRNPIEVVVQYPIFENTGNWYNGDLFRGMPHPIKEITFCKKYVWTQVSPGITNGYIYSDRKGRFFIDYDGEFIENQPIQISTETELSWVYLLSKKPLFVMPIDNDSNITVITEDMACHSHKNDSEPAE